MNNKYRELIEQAREKGRNLEARGQGTLDLTTAHGAVEKLAKKDIYGGGIMFDLKTLDESEISGKFVINGEHLNALLPHLLTAIVETAKDRLEYLHMEKAQLNNIINPKVKK